MKNQIQILLFSMLMAGCAQDKEAFFALTNDSTLITNRGILQDFFLCKCIDKGFKESNILKNDHSVSVLIEMASYRAEAFASVDSLANTVVARTPVSNLSGKRGLLLNCIDYYNGKSLNDFIKSLDKKIDNRVK